MVTAAAARLADPRQPTSAGGREDRVGGGEGGGAPCCRRGHSGEGRRNGAPSITAHGAHSVSRGFSITIQFRHYVAIQNMFVFVYYFFIFFIYLFIRTPTGNTPLKGDVASSSEFVTYLRRYSQSLTYRITMRLKAQNVSLKMSARSQWFKKAFATRGKRQNRPDCTVFTLARGSLNSL